MPLNQDSRSEVFENKDKSVNQYHATKLPAAPVIVVQQLQQYLVSIIMTTYRLHTW